MRGGQVTSADPVVSNRARADRSAWSPEQDEIGEGEDVVVFPDLHDHAGPCKLADLDRLVVGALRFVGVATFT